MTVQHGNSFCGFPADIILYVIGEVEEVSDVVCLRQSCRLLSSMTRERSIWVRFAQQFWQNVWSPNYSTLTLPKTLEEIVSLPTHCLEALVTREARLTHRWNRSGPIRFRMVKEIPTPSPPYEPGESYLLPGGRWLLRTSEGKAGLFDLSEGSLLWEAMAPHSATGIYFFRWTIDPGEENLFVSAHPFSGQNMGPGPQLADVWKVSLKTSKGELIRRVVTPYAYSARNVALSSTMLVTGHDIYSGYPQNPSSKKKITCFDIRERDQQHYSDAHTPVFDDLEITLESVSRRFSYGFFLVSEFLIVLTDTNCSAFDIAKARGASDRESATVPPMWLTTFLPPTKFPFWTIGVPIARRYRTEADTEKWQVEIIARKEGEFQTWVQLDCEIPPHSVPLFKLSVLRRAETATDSNLPVSDSSKRVFIWPTDGYRNYSRIGLGYFPSLSGDNQDVYVKSNPRLIEFPEFRGIGEVYGDGLSGVFCVIGARKEAADHAIVVFEVQ